MATAGIATVAAVVALILGLVSAVAWQVNKNRKLKKLLKTTTHARTEDKPKDCADQLGGGGGAEEGLLGPVGNADGPNDGDQQH